MAKGKKHTKPTQTSKAFGQLKNRSSAPNKVVNLDPMRLNKYIAHSGICSRRKAIDLIKQGDITVNGAVCTEPGTEVSFKDKVLYKGKPVKPETQYTYILMNKPKNVITTVQDEKCRATVMDIVGSSIKQRVYPVGRLDRMTTGLLLLTNDGDLTKKLSHPSHEASKTYHVTLDRPLAEADLALIRAGIRMDEGILKVDGINHIVNKPPTVVGVTLHLGWNRVVRRLLEQLKYEVLKLDRVEYGGLTKKDLPRGKFRHLTQREVIMLKHFA